jgi:hypothetical protein
VRSIRRGALYVTLVAALVLVPGPTGALADHGIVDLTSTGPAGGNGPFSTYLVSQPLLSSTERNYPADGARAIFGTAESLVAADTDGQVDLYERVGGTTNLVSTGPAGGNGPYGVGNNLTSRDGTRIFFQTDEALVSADDDGGGADVYERSGGTTTLVTADRPLGDGLCLVDDNTYEPCDMGLVGASDSGDHVLFMTAARLTSADQDSEGDLYERYAGTTFLVSTGQMRPGAYSGRPSEPGLSADGSRVFFVTAESLAPSDTDSCPGAPFGCEDLYERAGGTTTLLSTGPAASNASARVTDPAFSLDGSRAFFTTDESLVSEDTDGRADIYMRSGGTTTLVSQGSAGGNGPFPVGFRSDVSEDGSHVYFTTTEQLVSADSDSATDVYEWVNGATRLVSTGPGGNGPAAVELLWASADGQRVFFTTTERLTPDDTDDLKDIYVNSTSGTQLVSTGPTDNQVPCPNPNSLFCDPTLLGLSHDGSRAFFETAERLVPEDTDSNADIYERHGGATTLISTGPTGGNGAVNYQGPINVSEDGGTVYFQAGEPLVPGDTDSQQDVYRTRVPTGYPRPKSASPLIAYLVPAFQPCTSPNRTHGPPLAFGSCSSPEQESSNLTIGTADANGKPTNSTGYARFDGLAGNPSTPADEADVGLALILKDVRRSDDLSDYSGEVELKATIRITDKLGGSGGSEPATVEDISFPVTVGCAPTSADDIGATCLGATTADALAPGAISEGKRTIWELGQVELLDGGPDGVASTDDNELFEVEGLFVP